MLPTTNTWTQAEVLRNFTAAITTPKLTYTGADTKDFRIGIVATFRDNTDPGTNREMEVKFVKNAATAIPATGWTTWNGMMVVRPGAGQYSYVQCQYIIEVELAQNDYVSMFVVRASNANNRISSAQIGAVSVI